MKLWKREIKVQFKKVEVLVDAHASQEKKKKRVKLHNNKSVSSRGWILSLNTQGKGEVG